VGRVRGVVGVGGGAGGTFDAEDDPEVSPGARAEGSDVEPACDSVVALGERRERSPNGSDAEGEERGGRKLQLELNTNERRSVRVLTDDQCRSPSTCSTRIQPA